MVEISPDVGRIVEGRLPLIIAEVVVEAMVERVILWCD